MAAPTSDVDDAPPPRFRTGGMVPPASALPDVLPTDRLSATGMALPGVREPLRRIASWRNAVTVTVLWAAIVGLFAGAAWLDHPLGYLALFVLMGPMFARLAILGHEAAHRLLFRNRRANDLVGRWLLDAPAFVPFDIYRRSHFAHHREEFGAAEPDLAYYSGYPMPADSFRRKLVRDAVALTLSGRDVVQGFAVGRPMGAADLARWLGERRNQASLTALHG